jgi:hypothetical protein
MAKFKKGDVVVANKVVVDIDVLGDYYIHALAGGIGVVNDYGQEPPSVDVTWHQGGQCTMHEDDLDHYPDPVVCVVDEEKEETDDQRGRET